MIWLTGNGGFVFRSGPADEFTRATAQGKRGWNHIYNTIWMLCVSYVYTKKTMTATMIPGTFSWSWKTSFYPEIRLRACVFLRSLESKSRIGGDCLRHFKTWQRLHSAWDKQQSCCWRQGWLNPPKNWISNYPGLQLWRPQGAKVTRRQPLAPQRVTVLITTGPHPPWRRIGSAI